MPALTKLATHLLAPLALAFLESAPAIAHAATLQWTTTTLELKPAAGADTAAGTLSFFNPGPEAITIERVTPSCGCVTATVGPNTYRSAQSGAVTVAVDLRGLSGVQEQSITVLTSSESKQTTVLHVRIRIPDLVLTTPAVLTWAKDEPPSPREIMVTAGTDIPIKVTGFTCDDANFTVTSEPIESGQRYRLHITPQTTSSARHATLRLQALTTTQKSEARTVYLIIR